MNLAILLLGQIFFPGDQLAFLGYSTFDNGENYVIIRKPRYDGRTTIKVKGPPGRRVIIINTLGRVIKRGHTPLTVFVGLPGRYTLDIEGIGEITLYVKRGMDNIVEIRERDYYEDDYPIRIEVEEGRDYLLLREPYHRTILEIRKPPGYEVELWRRGHLIRRGITPVKWTLSGGGLYRIILKQGPIVAWRKSIEVWRNYRHRLYLWPPRKPLIKPMPQDKFEKLIEMLYKESFEDAKLDIVRTAAKDNYFTSQQVKQIMEAFKFDENRLEVAKILYPRVVDKENFFIVLSTLTFPSSREELRKWIEEQGGTYDYEDGDWEEWKEGWD